MKFEFDFNVFELNLRMWVQFNLHAKSFNIFIQMKPNFSQITFCFWVTWLVDHQYWCIAMWSSTLIWNNGGIKANIKLRHTKQTHGRIWGTCRAMEFWLVLTIDRTLHGTWLVVDPIWCHVSYSFHPYLPSENDSRSHGNQNPLFQFYDIATLTTIHKRN
jgi:hypothetical protein